MIALITHCSDIRRVYLASNSTNMKAKDYFVFTKRERSGIISLIVLVLVVIIIPKFYKSRTPVAETIPEVITGDTVMLFEQNNR